MGWVGLPLPIRGVQFQGFFTIMDTHRGLEIGIRFAFDPNRGGSAVTGKHFSIVWQGEQAVLDRVQQGLRVGVRDVCTSNGTRKQRVA